MNTTVYSFSDVTLLIKSPRKGNLTITGQGVGSIAISRSNDMTQHDIAADGSIMISKIVTKNGTVAISLQQTSEAHKWLKDWLADLVNASSSEWANTSAQLDHPEFKEQIIINGISPQKRADASFQNAGQQVTWNLMAAEIIG